MMRLQKKSTGVSLTNKQLQKIIDKEKMEAWAIKHPFAAVMMSDIPYKEKLKYAKKRFI